MESRYLHYNAKDNECKQDACATVFLRRVIRVGVIYELPLLL